MKLDSKTAKLLGINNTELRILSCIEKTALTISQLSIASKIPRTSLYYILPSLTERYLVIKTKDANKIYWKKNSDEQIKFNIQNALDKISNQNESNFTSVISQSSEITFYHGAKNMEQIFEEIASTPVNARWFGIQPGPSIMDLIPKVSIEIITKFNKTVKNKRHIVEGIVHENYLDKMKDILGIKDYKNLLQSFGGRSSDYAKLPADYMKNISSEIYLFNGKIAIANWKDEFAIIIKNPDMFALLMEMFKSTKYLLERYDQNEKIAKKLIDLG